MTPAPSAKSCCSNNTRPASRLGGTDDDDNDAGSPEHGTVDPLAPFQISAMANNNYGGNNTKTNTNNMRRAEFLISGMTCSMCSQAVEKVVRGLAGVREVSISLTTDSAWVVWDDSLSNQQDIVTAIEAIGYDVEDSKVAVALNNVDPTTATTNDSRSSDTRPTAPDDSTTVEERWRRYRQRQNDKVKTRRSAFLWAMVGTLPILTLTMILPHVIPNLFGHRRVEIPVLNHELDLEALVLLLLATPVQFLCGWEFYKMAWYGFLSGRAGMDTLVALGTTASYGYALCGAWKGDEHAAHFFETSAVLIAFVLAGKWMQVAAMQRTSDVLTQLMELRSPTAIKITPHQRPDAEAQHRSFNPLVDPYNEEVVDTDKIVVGDIVKIIRGASIPADGRVMYGEISVDESMVTGESLPVLKTKGSVVLGGTICVESDTGGETDDQHPRANAGAAFVQVSGVGSSTALARIVQLVQQAQTRAVPIQSFADQVSAVFVPAVCTISLVTYLVWYVVSTPKHQERDPDKCFE